MCSKCLLKVLIYLKSNETTQTNNSEEQANQSKNQPKENKLKQVIRQNILVTTSGRWLDCEMEGHNHLTWNHWSWEFWEVENLGQKMWLDLRQWLMQEQALVSYGQHSICRTNQTMFAIKISRSTHFNSNSYNMRIVSECFFRKTN